MGVIKSQSFRVGPMHYRVELLRIPDKNHPGDYHEQGRIFQNGKLVAKLEGGGDASIGVLPWPNPGKLIALTDHSMAGHGLGVSLYQASRTGVRDLKAELPTESEVGGPIYRDLDHDGTFELLFDNYDFHEAWGPGNPALYIVYKFDGQRLKEWKRLPNIRAKRLPFRLPSPYH